MIRQSPTRKPNLYMGLRLGRGAPRPAAALSPDGKLKPPWVALIGDFPDRFMLGSDAFYARDGIARGSSDDGMNNLRGLVTQLPENVASKVASENAIRVYRLKNVSGK